MRTTHRVAKAVKKALAAPGMMLVQLNGSGAGQSIPHVHFHVLPRREGLDLQPAWARGRRSETTGANRRENSRRAFNGRIGISLSLQRNSCLADFVNKLGEDMLKTCFAPRWSPHFWLRLPMAAQAAHRRAPGAAAYCVKKGGVVQTRMPEYNTNGGNPLILAGQRDFCQFTIEKGREPDLRAPQNPATRQPSLAALAYYAEVPMGTCNGNPASCYCTLLGGSDLFGGINRPAAAGC